MERILAFFGAFNPPTLAHLELARYALMETGREKVLFVPSKSVYIKDEQGKDFAFEDGQRYAMLVSAAKSRPWMQVTDWEMKQSRQPRTYDTLCHLKDTGLDAALLMGSDKLPELEHGWLHVKEIAEEHGIVCLSRSGDDCKRIIRENEFLSSLSPNIMVLETPETFQNVSSTAVRKRLAMIKNLQQEVRGMVPEEICSLLL